ncbi:MAG: protein TolR, partial [Gammaproteobacteria bacterium]|nr:protein TolR [Gammaproteobacteria bacterium]
GQQVGIIISTNPDIQVLVEGDTDAGWGAMVNLITTLQAAGVANPNFITQPLGDI